jgi:DNA invertase Pin-like site-specific DNA recombinase
LLKKALRAYGLASKDAADLAAHLAAVIEASDRQEVSARTKAALAAAKARGQVLGNPHLAAAQAKGAAANRTKAKAQAKQLQPVLRDLAAEGITSYSAIAKELNRRGVATAGGGSWHPQTVKNLMRRQP